MLVIDEAGFGTKVLKKYGYSKIGTPAVREKRTLGVNLSCITTISSY